MEQLTALLSQLVAIDSRNPDLVPGAPGESEIAQTIATLLAQAGVEVEIIGAEQGRPSVIGIVRGSGDGPSLLLNAHTDIVGFGNMADPLVPRIEQGRMYARGSYDMKSGLVAILQTAITLAHEGKLRGNLIITAVSDEEYASIGTAMAIEYLREQKIHVDAAVVTEPTELGLCVAHKGFVWATITTHGLAAHGSRPHEGIDAIMHMGRVLAALEQHQQRLQQRPAHPLLGHASLHASLISGGTGLSTYPDHCELQIEWRTMPGESPESIKAEIDAILAELSAADPQFKAEARLDLHQPALETPLDSPLVQIVQSVVDEQTGSLPSIMGVSFWMDSALLGAAGIPTIIYGPLGTGAHADVEWVDLASMQTCYEVLCETARRFCGTN
jgi:acetylornithine deacetylase